MDDEFQDTLSELSHRIDKLNRLKFKYHLMEIKMCGLCPGGEEFLQ